MLKQVAKSAIRKLKLLQVVQSVARPRILILRYHSVRKDPALLDDCISVGITHSLAVFRSQIEYVAKRCNPISLERLADVTNGRIEVPRRGVVVTFDDGFMDNYAIAAPVLEEYGLRGVFYIPTSSVEGRSLWFIRLRHWQIRGGKSRQEFLDVSSRCAVLSDSDREEFMARLGNDSAVPGTFSMTWAQARELRSRGHIIGSHSVNHPNIAKVSSNEMKTEMECSKRTIEERLDCRVEHFSYPNPILEPHWDRSTIQACRCAHYRTAVTSTEGHVVQGTNALALPRHAVPNSFDEFVWNLEMAFNGSKR